MKQKFVNLYIDFAHRVSQLSYARRLKVGAVIVKDDTVISYGYNGTPSGWDNNCEMHPKIADPQTLEIIEKTDILVTKPEVLHAEMNSLMKLARGSNSGDGAVMFITHSPCMECAKGIYQSGIKHVYYRDQYRTNEGIEFLEKCGIDVTKVDENLKD